MFSFNKNLILSLKEFSQRTHFISVQTTIEFKSEKIYEVLHQVKNIFPELSKPSGKKEEGQFILKKGAENIEQEILFGIFIKGKKIGYSFGAENEFPAREKLEALFRIVQDKLEINEFNIEFNDYGFLTISEKDVNYNEIVKNTFYRDTILSKFLEKVETFANPINLKAVIDEKHIFFLAIENSVSRDEALNKKYRNDRLEIKLGIAQMAGYSNEEFTLSDRIIENLLISQKFFEDKFIPSILIPLENELQKIKAKE